jgi:hypothetical protein
LPVAGSEVYFAYMTIRLMLKICLGALALAGGSCLRVEAMDRWAALSQIETGDRDAAVGPGGEVSRYQIQLAAWRQHAPAKADPRNPEDALAVARKVMEERLAQFEVTFHRSATDFEFYVLWNAPAQIQKPSQAVSRRAERFRNLVESH